MRDLFSVMDILLVSQYFWPEEFRFNDVAEELVKRGHRVTVLTGKPNYPKGKIYEGYKKWGVQKETYKGAEVIRVPLFPRGKSGSIRLVLNYLSFVFFSKWYIRFHKRNYDVSFSYATSPIMQVNAALLQKHLRGTPAYLWIQDLWPESVEAAGKLKSGFGSRWLSKVVRKIYQQADGICVQSPAFVESVIKHGADEKKITYIPNWAPDLYLSELSADEKTKYNDVVPEGFKVMFAGNIGEAQDFGSIIKAAEILKDKKDIKWVIVGDGRRREYAEKIIAEKGIQDNFCFLGRYPSNEMPSMLGNADLLLVSLKDSEIFARTIPSKIQAYMAVGKPIAAMLNGIGGEIVKEADCGYVTQSGNAEGLAKCVLEAYNESPENLEEKGTNARKYYDEHFSKDKIIDNLLKELTKHSNHVSD